MMQTRTRKIIFATGFSITLALVSLMHTKNEICCMFASIRERGFPFAIVSLGKTTDSLTEAEKIYHLSDAKLIRSGWKVALFPNTLYYSRWESTPLTLAFYLSIGIITVLGVNKIRS